MKYEVYQTTGNPLRPLTLAAQIDAKNEQHAITVAKRKGYRAPIVEGVEHRIWREQNQREELQ